MQNNKVILLADEGQDKTELIKMAINDGYEILFVCKHDPYYSYGSNAADGWREQEGAGRFLYYSDEDLENSKTTENNKNMDWNNVNLKDAYERDQNILDGYDFDTLLLEISTNIRSEDINEATITANFEQELKNKMYWARDIFKNNLQNILKEAKGKSD